MIEKLLKPKLDKYRLFAISGLFLISLNFLGIILAMLGSFHSQIFFAYILFGGFFLLFLFLRNNAQFSFDKSFLLVSIFSVLAVFVFSYFTAPTIFSGRDQGSLSEAAIRLSQNNGLTFSSPAGKEFFKIYGPGPALNFPGFNYTAEGDLTTQFPLGYISWLAIFYSIFGLLGLQIANGISALFFLVSFYLVAKEYLHRSSAVLAWLLILTSFTFSWFFKFTLSENLAMMLLWFGIFLFILFRKKNERFFLLSALSAFILLSFVRIEAFAFLAIILVILFVEHRSWKRIFFGMIGKNFLILPAALISIYILHLFSGGDPFLQVLKNILRPAIALATSLKGHAVPEATSFFATPLYVFKVLFAYSLVNFVLFGLIGIIRLFKRKKYEMLIPFFIILPSFLYLIYPSISADHPWMLRRFAFSIIPLCIIYAVWFIEGFFRNKIYFHIVAALFLLSSLSISIPYLPVVPDKNLLPQIKEVSRNFESSDLVLVDRNATGDHWSMMSGPLNFLFGLQAAYFFNPEDLDRIDSEKFDRIYLIVPDSQLALYEEWGLLARMEPIEEYVIRNESLEIIAGKKKELYANPIRLPQSTDSVTHGRIYSLIQK